jgi:Protein of unknown function (DUF3800)
VLPSIHQCGGSEVRPPALILLHFFSKGRANARLRAQQLSAGFQNTFARYDRVPPDSFFPDGHGQVHFFIDEGGNFTPSSAWGVVCSLAIPHGEVGRAVREINQLTRDWPRNKGELKGGALKVSHLESLVDVLFRHDAIMHACAIDVSRESDKGLDDHKADQCNSLTKHMTSAHHPNVVREVQELRRTLERMPRQLYIQSGVMRELIDTTYKQVTTYFAQRRPRELAKFEWTIDAKDPRRITTQEEWWRVTLAPLMQNKSRREPFGIVEDAGFNYKYFDGSFAIKFELWDRPGQTADGYDLKKMITERIAFVASRSHILIQAVDILTSFLRRLLAGEIAGDEVCRALGRLQIFKTQRDYPHRSTS